MSNDVEQHMEDDLAEVTSLERIDERRFRLRVPDGWQQGRGAFGGLVLGALARAARIYEPDQTRELRAINGELAGPAVVGEAEITVEEVRRGNSLSMWSVALRQRSQVRTRATVVLGTTRVANDAPAPLADDERPQPWSEVAVTPLVPPVAPIFTRHFEFRSIGPMPMSGELKPTASGWIRPRRVSPTIGPIEAVAMVDAWWPVALARVSIPRPLATITFSAQWFPAARELPGDRPLFHRARELTGADGFFVELRELWTETGELVLFNQQTLVWI
ncbi:MAG: thioesterase family protein [Myxococcota bacterium]